MSKYQDLPRSSLQRDLHPSLPQNTRLLSAPDLETILPPALSLSKCNLINYEFLFLRFY